MDKLSAEILSLIFEYLHREQKLECMLVCRSWANALQNGHDLETIVMSYWPSSDRYGKSFTSLVENVRNNPSLGKKCRRLVLDGQININFHKDALGELFPNLTCLFLGTGGLITLINQTKHFPENIETEPDPLRHWKENLETLFVESEVMFYFDVLEYGVFKNLTTLVLGAVNELETMRFGLLFENLCNTPALKNLVFSWSDVQLDKLELLHKNLPKLESLTLLGSTFENHGDKPQNVQPAKSLKKFAVKSLFIFFSLPQITVEYLAQKYPNLQDFSVVLNEKYTAFSEDAKRKIELSMKYLLQQFGPKLTTLKLRLPYCLSDAMVVLDNTVTELEDLEANAYFGKKPLYRLLSFAKAHNLQALYLTQLPPFDCSIFKDIHGLKRLGLAFKDKNKNKSALNLYSILKNQRNTLESLEITHATINVTSGKSEAFGIKRLCLKSSTLPKGLPAFLTQHSPNLRSLVLSYCEVSPVFELPRHHLSYLELNILREKEPYCIRTDFELEKYKHKVTHLQLTERGATRYYRFPTEFKSENHPLHTHEYFNRHDHAIRFVCKSTQLENDLSYFQFSCASATTVFYNGHLVL